MGETQGLDAAWLNPKQRVSFLRVCDRLPRRLRELTFDLRSPEWILVVVEELGDVGGQILGLHWTRVSTEVALFV